MSLAYILSWNFFKLTAWLVGKCSSERAKNNVATFRIVTSLPHNLAIFPSWAFINHNQGFNFSVRCHIILWYAEAISILHAGENGNYTVDLTYSVALLLKSLCWYIQLGFLLKLCHIKLYNELSYFTHHLYLSFCQNMQINCMHIFLSWSWITISFLLIVNTRHFYSFFYM